MRARPWPSDVEEHLSRLLREAPLQFGHQSNREPRKASGSFDGNDASLPPQSDREEVLKAPVRVPKALILIIL